MSLEEDYLIERFLKGELSGEEDQRFRERMTSDVEFREKVTLEQQLFDTFDEDRWSDIEKTDHPEVTAHTGLFAAEDAKAMKAAIASSAGVYKANQKKPRIRPVWFYASAAAILLILSFYFLFPAKKGPEDLYLSYLDQTELPSLVTRGDRVSEQIKGQAYFENGEFAKAERVFADLIRQDNNNAAFYIYLSLAQAELTSFEQALTTLDRLIASDLLDSEKGYWYKSLVYLKANQPGQAERILSAIVDEQYVYYDLAKSLINDLD